MTKDSTDYISAERAGTLYGLFLERLSRSPDHTAYQSYSSQTENWYNTSWREVARQVARWQQALADEKLEPGDRVALNLRNCKEWIIFDQAAMGLGLIVVPLYPDDRPDNVAYILQDADVKCLFLQNTNQWKRLQSSITEEHRLSRVIINNDDDETLTGPAVYARDWLAAASGDLKQWDADPHQLASIIYTSGTTGRPKGVMLSHHNMLSVAAGALQYFDILPDDLFLSFLPLSHTLERTAGYYLPIMAGASVAFSRGIPQLADDMLTIKPTILIAVPRIFERIYTRLQAQLAGKPFISRFLFHANVTIGWAKFRYVQGRQGWRPSFLLLPLLNKLVASKVHQRMGGRLRLTVSGGAALPENVARLFIGLGVNLLQGYGLTETSPVVSVNEPDNNVPASVGRAIPGVAVKIGENDELMVRGPGNMLGYWNNHKATAQTIDAEGWLHTGDQARISDSGHIYITGRIKDILILSTGEKVPPVDIETAILADDHFEQALIVGEGKSYLSALLVLNSDKWFSLARELGLDAMDNASLNSKSLQQHVIQTLRQLLHDFPTHAKIRRVTLTLEPWTVENGLLTPTLKVKRAKVIEHHQQDILNMYRK
ncbi:AMP-dependent synthetase/ligase [Methylophaga sp. OBS4]|uniref:AMP-dependent synthetase/ligase n=1 Tax=Methylophaga sp. OBS4 TaxID=2991935 RepID=UPI002256CB30|nr:AMP-dependent synthetase/ligase [Methylophaga sp. OBS4]MCX4188460.1 AMP-dependent synthetase/ligase [Methylophaga sp. OBS4]